MIDGTKNNLKELSQILGTISNEVYTRPSQYLFGSSIGKHIRHILEMYEILIAGYSNGKFSFENRERRKDLEESVEVMLSTIKEIISAINKKDKELIFVLNNNEDDEKHFKTTYFRELLYCFEHGIHHQALIKVALKEYNWENIPENFGVAPSTIKFRLSCAQ